MYRIGGNWIRLLGMVTWALCGIAVASPPSESAAKTMRDLASDVEGLMPYIYSYDKVLTSDEREFVSSRMALMAAHVDRIGETVAPRADTYQISYQILGSQLEQAQKAFANGREQYGFGLLRSAVSVCSTCHTQDDRKSAWLAPETKTLQDPYVAGEFLFMTRRYDRAFDAYNDWLSGQESLEDDGTTQMVFGRLLLTSLQMQKSASVIKSTLASYAGSDKVSGPLRVELNDWVAGIDELQGIVDLSMQPDTESLKDMATDWLRTADEDPYGHLYLPDNQRPRVLWLRGELYRALLSETDRTMIPRWLYWLALSDRLLEYRFYYSLADLYLRQCMVEYSDDPIARLCYREYENYLVFFNSGSGGTYVPDDVKHELEQFKARIFK